MIAEPIHRPLRWIGSARAGPGDHVMRDRPAGHRCHTGPDRVRECVQAILDDTRS